MKLLIEKLPDLQALYLNQLRLLLSAEQQVADSLPRLIEKATDSHVKDVFKTQLGKIENRRKGIEAFVGRANPKVHPIGCKTMSSLIDEAEDIIQEADSSAVCDAGLLSTAHKILQYEEGSYGVVNQLAQALGLQGDAQILDESMRGIVETKIAVAGISQQVNRAALRISK